jgi:hypothetical protein
MSKSTKHEADETFSIQLSKKEWNDMYDEDKKTFENYHGLLHLRLFERIGGCCPFKYTQKYVRKGKQRAKLSPLINITAECLNSGCNRQFAFLIYDNDIESNNVKCLVKVWGQVDHSNGEQKKRKKRGKNDYFLINQKLKNN